MSGDWRPVPGERPGRGPVGGSAPARRVAGVEVGSFSVRCLAVEEVPGGGRRVLDDRRFPVRAGTGAFSAGALDGRTRGEIVRSLAEIKAALDRLHVSCYRAVATEALRASCNGAALVGRVRRATGLALEIIDGREEIRLVQRAVAGSVSPVGRRLGIVDLGGGTLDACLAGRHGVVAAQSLPLGTLRLRELFAGVSADLGALRRRAAEILPRLEIDLAAGASQLVGIGGTIEQIARLAGEEHGPGAARVLGLAGLEKFVRDAALLSRAELVSRLGLDADRAEVILPAALIYERVARLADAGHYLVPFVGVRDGLVIELLEKSGEAPAMNG